jgi:hypothetical protein
MNLFPVITSLEDRERIQAARIRRANRPNLAAWASAQIQLSRAQSGHSHGAEVLPNPTGAPLPKTTEASQSVE